ncbi:MAG: Trk system potassium transporter TrkA [Verrucomicrobiales bacterium]
MNIIVVGSGEIGRHLALRLAKESHQITVIEVNDRLAGDLDNQIDAKVLCSDGTSVNTLLEADVHECDLLFAVTSDNNVNLVSASLAKKLGAGKVICRVHPELQREEWLFDHRGHFGIDHIFSSERLAALELSKFVRNPDSLLVEDFAHGRIELQQVRVSATSDVVGTPLSDLKLPARIRVGAIDRGDDTIIPSGSDTLQAGDIVSIFGEPRPLREIVCQIGRDGLNGDALKVVIFGGGEYGFSLAQMLESWDCRVRIFESDAARCEELSRQLANVTVLNVDATSLSELKEEQVGEADFFVATTHSDEDNVMTCIQAHSIGAKACLTIIHRADYADAISRTGSNIGIVGAVSPREATRRELMRFVTSDKYHVIKPLEAGEIIETRVPENARIANQKVSDIAWPEGSGLVALLHGVKASVPTGDDLIQEGDHIYAMVSSKAKKKFLKLFAK